MDGDYLCEILFRDYANGKIPHSFLSFLPIPLYLLKIRVLKIRIVVYNTDSSGKAAAKPAGATGTHHHHRDEIIGEVSFTLPSLIRSSGQAVTLDLKKDGVSKGSQIIITGEEEIETNEARKAIATSFTGRNLALDSMSFFSTPETFLTLSRCV